MEQEASSRDKCRVLFVSHDGGLAGAQQCLLMAMRGLNMSRYAPHLVVPYMGDLSSRAEELGITTICREIVPWVSGVSCGRRKSRWSQLSGVIKGLRERAWAIAHLIEKYDIDIVYSNTVTVVEGAVAAVMTKRQHVWHIHEPLKGNDELFPLLPSWLYERVIEKLSDYIIFPSNVIERYYNFRRKNVAVVNNGTNSPQLLQRGLARQHVLHMLDLEIDKERPLVGVVGALQPRKDHLTLFRAMRRVREAVPNVLLLVVGVGADEVVEGFQAVIREWGIEENVYLCGRWDGSIEIFMAAMDVLAVSSTQESFGLTVIEALAQETPVVATQCGGPEEIIEDGKEGLLVGVGDSDGLAAGLVRLVEDESLRRNMGRAGRRKVTDKFSEENYCSGIQQVLERVCCGSRVVDRL